MNNTEEKFISIPYSVWNNKYKPMEEELARVKAELDKEIESKKHYVYLKTARFSFQKPIYMADQTMKSCVAYFDIDTEKMEELSDIPEMDKLKAIINGKLEENFYELYSKKPIVYTQEEGKDVIKELINKDIALNKTLNKINSLPRIVKWLFNIRNV